MRYCALASLIFIAASPYVSAQPAYFSLEGVIPNTATAAVNFNFSLSRSVTAPELFRFETDSWKGGLNAAGDVIPAYGFDAELELFDSGRTSLAVSNEIDDGGSGEADFDALLSWASVPGVLGTPIPSPRPAGEYQLNLREFGNGFQTDWAAELRGPADAMTFTGATGVNGGTVTSLKFGAGAGGAATYRLSSDLTVIHTLGVLNGGQLDAGGAAGQTGAAGENGRSITSSGELHVEGTGAILLQGGDGGTNGSIGSGLAPGSGGRGRINRCDRRRLGGLRRIGHERRQRG